MATRAINPIFKCFTTTGALAASYKLYTYEAGTTTLLTTYQDSAETTPHANPIVLDSLGEAPEIFITESAKFTLTDADDNVIDNWPIDNIDPTTTTAAQVSNETFSDIVATNVQDALEELKADIDEKADPADVVDTGFGEMPSGITMSGMIGGEAAIGTDTDHDLDFAPFLCKDSTNAVVIYSTDSISKQLDAAWSAGGTPGTPAGGLLNGTIAANTVYLWVYMGDGASGVDVGFLALADIADIATHVTAAGFDYYKVGGFRHTNASSNWAGFTQTGDYLIGWKSDDNIISNSVTTTLATKTHANHIADDYTELICYGARDATDNGTLYASDDGTNISLVVGRATVSVSTTDQHAWGEAGQANTAFVPYLASRQFASSNATIDLLLHGVKFKR